jgi:DNA polymerase-3 subunit delta'
MPVLNEKQWDFLKNRYESGQLAHAYLFSGQEGTEKKSLAKRLVKYANCLSLQKPCENCVNCRMIEKGNFPDLMVIKPEDSGEIQIAKIREVQNFLNYKSYYGFLKAVIAENSEKMNQEAQSCFLKTLEEPKGKTVIFLISSKPEILLETIRSRCQQIKFFGRMVQNKENEAQEREILKGILAVSGKDFSEKFKYAKSLDFEKQKLSDILEVFEKYLRHLLLKKAGVEEKSHFSAVSSCIEKYPISKIQDVINITEDISNKLFFTNVSQKLALETLLLEI